MPLILKQKLNRIFPLYSVITFPIATNYESLENQSNKTQIKRSVTWIGHIANQKDLR